MYRKKTVFILGAGSSHYYGYPLGKDLIPSMIKSLDDQIPIPVLNKSKKLAFYNGTDKRNGILYDYEETKKFLLEHKEFHENSNIEFVPSSRSEGRLQLWDGKEILGRNFQNEFYCVQMGELDKFDELKKRLLISNPPSIDAFLRNNSDLNEVAKILIIYTLLKCENPDSYNLDYLAQTEFSDPWLSVLFNELTQGCSNPHSVIENNIDFITFNYDVNLEYFFYRIFKETQIFNENSDDIIDFLNNRIDHVYGNLPTIKNLSKYGYYNDLNQFKNTTSFYRFLHSLIHNNYILTIHEERTNNNPEKIQIIKDAEVINILGFGFDRDNLNVLGFPSSIDNWAHYHAGLKRSQKINYLNFNGLNTKLKSEFDLIARSFKGQSYLDVNESKAKRITDALLYDFKSFLFEE